MITKYDKTLKILISFCFIFITIFTIYGVVVSPRLDLFRESAHIYDEPWTKHNADGSEEPFKMPTSLNLAADEKVTVSTVLPEEVENGMYLAINTGKCFTMSIEGKEIYGFDNTIAKLPGKITKAVVVPVPLKDEYAGKELTMIITDGKYRRPSINSAYIGSLMGIEIILLKNQGLQFVMAALLIIASLVTIGIFTYIEKRDGKKAPLIYLAEGILAISLWIILDSPLFQVVCDVYFFDGILGFMLVIIMCLPFLLYFDAISEYRSHIVYVIFESIIVINFVVLTFLHLADIVSFHRVLIYIDLMVLVYIGVIIACTIKDYLGQNGKSHKNVIFGIMGLSLFSFLEIVITILNANMPFKIDIGGLAVLVGMIILLFFAILDQVQAFNDFRQATQNAIAATKAKSDFLANMSHEIRTPINAIMGMNEMIRRDSYQAVIKDYAEDISSASENLLRIVNDILDFSKIESGKLEIICDEYDLGELIYDVTTLVNMKAENKGLKLNINIDESLPYKLYGDDKRVRQILTNILNNAVKYTQEGYINLKINGVAKENTIALNISVEDSGQGIKEEDLDKIFGGFAQVNAKQNKNIEGTGLGLTITKSLVELMEGSISVISEYGKGSTFRVILPQKVLSDEKMGNYVSHRHASSQNKDAKTYEIASLDSKILVVDDTPLNLKVISKLLSQTGAEVELAESGEKMLSLITDNYYDIILLDHMMPNMDGIEALTKSKTLDNNKCLDVPVIALTANAIVGAKEMYLEAGFDDYLSKPVKYAELCDMLIKYLPSDQIHYV